MNWPSTLVAYHRSVVFTEDTIPEGLRTDHELKPGVWALVRVLEGELVFLDLDEAREGRLTPAVPGFIEPGMRHRVEPRGSVKFYVEFYRDASEPGTED